MPKLGVPSRGVSCHVSSSVVQGVKYSPVQSSRESKLKSQSSFKRKDLYKSRSTLPVPPVLQGEPDHATSAKGQALVDRSIGPLVG